MAGLGTAAGLITAISHLTPAEAAALWSAVTLVTGVISGLLQKPPHVAVTMSAVTAVLGDLAALNVHVPPAWQGIGMSLLAVLGGSVVHLSAVRPAVTIAPMPENREVPPGAAIITIPAR